MPDAPKQPVTVGDLRLPCEHKRYDEHAVRDGRFFSQLKISRLSESGDREALATVTICKSRPATVADLVSALRAEGVLVVQRACALVNKPGHQGCTAGGHEWVWNEGIVEIATTALLKRFALDKTEAKDTTIETFREDARVMLDALAEAQPFPPAGG